jgi:hypothetical protein
MEPSEYSILVKPTPKALHDVKTMVVFFLKQFSMILGGYLLDTRNVSQEKKT